MNKIFTAKYGWIVALLVTIILNWVAGSIHFRADLTGEKRYSLSSPTKRILRSLE